MPKVVPEYKEDAKRRIIEAAMDVIAERGCERMTFDDVAKKLGVTKGAVYWYFANKDELITAVLNKFRTEILNLTFESYYNRPLEETLSLVFDRFSYANDRHRAIFFELFALASRNPEVMHATFEYNKGLVATFEEAIIKEKRKKFIQTQADAHRLAQLLAAFFTGLQNNGVWTYKEEMKEMWLEGARIILKPSYTGNYGEDKE
jgi:AcrR family transcriptional regulator